MATKTFEEAFEEFKKVPDWDRFPLPEFMYEKYGIKKPRTGDVMDIVTYSAPPHQSLNKNGKVELLPLAEGGVRKIELGPELPTEVKLLDDEGKEIEMPKPAEQKPIEIRPLTPFPREASVSELPAYLKMLEASLKD
jgi:hypothetical protein